MNLWNYYDGDLKYPDITKYSHEKEIAKAKSEWAFEYIEKNGGEDFKENQALVVEKQTVGELADKTKNFTFRLTLRKAKTAKDETIIGKIGNKEVKFTYGEEKEFQLRDGEQLVFEKLPAGTSYNAVEVGETDGYKKRLPVLGSPLKNFF